MNTESVCVSCVECLLNWKLLNCLNKEHFFTYIIVYISWFFSVINGSIAFIFDLIWNVCVLTNINGWLTFSKIFSSFIGNIHGSNKRPCLKQVDFCLWIRNKNGFLMITSILFWWIMLIKRSNRQKTVRPLLTYPRLFYQLSLLI